MGNKMANQDIIVVTDQNFEQEVLKEKIPVLVDFFADWCEPCKMLTPIFEEISLLYKDRVKLVKMDIGEAPKTPAKVSVRGVPTLILFKNGIVEATKVGLLAKSQLLAFIDTNI